MLDFYPAARRDGEPEDTEQVVFEFYRGPTVLERLLGWPKPEKSVFVPRYLREARDS
ncbi:MAG: hypothetical protein AAF675_17020 [Pseudomonadota bacterium]